MRTRIHPVSALALCALALAGCSSSPTTPTPKSSAVPLTTIAGTVTATNDGVAVGGAIVTITVAAPLEEAQPIATTTTDAAGLYSLTTDRQAAYLRLTVSREGMITRTAYIEGGRSRTANVDLFREDGTFHLSDFRVIARSGVSGADPVYYPLKPVTRSVTLYLATVTSWPPPSKPVDPARIDFVQNVILSSIAEMTEGRVTVTGVERGPITEYRPGYLTVAWRDFDAGWGICADAFYPGGDRPGVRLVSSGCSCGQFQFDPGNVRHWLGHALGLQDTSLFGDLMYERMEYTTSLWRPGVCDVKASAQERRYLRYLYSRPYGNTDPDDDPKFSVLP